MISKNNWVLVSSIALTFFVSVG